ncbi:MAG: prolipoprotein diacylglyceryl transferase [Myxococcota bacterium]
MHPWFLHWGPVQVSTYLACISAGLTVGVFVLQREARRSNLSVRDVLWTSIAVVPAGVVGARVFHVLLEQPFRYLADPVEAFMPWAGFTWYGSMLGAAAALVWRARRLQLDPRRILDCFAPAVPLGHAFARLGCLGAGCCHGRPLGDMLGFEVPWGLVAWRQGSLPESLVGVPLHPWPLYASLALILQFVLLTQLRARQQYDGQAILGLFALYGMTRTLLEPLRGDIARGLFFGGWISTSQIVGLSTALIAWGIHRTWSAHASRSV